MLTSPAWLPGTRGAGGVRLAAPRMTAEFRLMAWCASALAEGRDRDRDATVPAMLDWGYLLRLCRRHRIGGLVHAGMRVEGVVPPSAVAAVLEAEANKIAVDELWSAAETLRLDRLLRANGVEPLVLKGVAVAMLAFNRLGLRYNRDIDILVRPQDVEASLTLLAADGYHSAELTGGDGLSRRWLQLHKDVALMHESGRGIVELHWRLFDNPSLLGDERIIGEPVRLTGAGAVETLPGQLNLIYLCIHGAEHAWYRLKWLLDIHALAMRMSDEELAALYAAARAKNVHRAVAQALLLCARLFGMPIPAVVAQSRRDPRIRLLEALALRSLLAGGDLELTETRFGTTLMNLSHYLLVDGWRYWTSEFAYDVADDSRAPPPRLLRRLGPLGRLIGWAALHLSKPRREQT